MQESLQSIVDIAGCYRQGELGFQFDTNHVQRWVNQFDQNIQKILLDELAYVLKKTYLKKESLVNFVNSVVDCEEIYKSNQKQFWHSANFIRGQQAGGSQSAIYDLISSSLKQRFDFGIEDCKGAENYFYIDDFLCSGGTALRDLKSWADGIDGKVKLYIITVVEFTGSYYYINKLKEYIRKENNNISIILMRAINPENRSNYKNSSDVLWPNSCPNEANSYVEGFQNRLQLRKTQGTGTLKLFSSEEGRNLLEQEFTKAGIKVRNMCPNLPDQLRPLGAMFLDSLGFGCMYLTYRNCPNNAPLALWASDPWYPLFPRKIN